MKTCPACHTEIIDATSRFCPNCGAPLRSADNPYATPSPTGNAGDDISKTGTGFARSGSGSSGYGSGSSGYGTPTPPPSSYYSGYASYTPPAAQPSGGLAIAALICSFLIGIVGFILGIIGLGRYPKGNSYRTMCIVAIILPIVWFVLMMLFVMIGVAGSAAMY